MKKILHVAETIKGGVATVIRTISASPEGQDSNYELVYLVPLDQKKSCTVSMSSRFARSNAAGAMCVRCCVLPGN